MNDIIRRVRKLLMLHKVSQDHLSFLTRVCFRVVVFRKYSSEIFSWKFLDFTMRRILNNFFRV